MLSRTRRALVDQGSLCCTHRSITSLGYTLLNIVMLTCSHTLSLTSISRNLYIESSLVFLLSGSLPDLELSVFFFPFLALSEMYCAAFGRQNSLGSGLVERSSGICSFLPHLAVNLI